MCGLVFIPVQSCLYILCLPSVKSTTGDRRNVQLFIFAETSYALPRSSSGEQEFLELFKKALSLFGQNLGTVDFGVGTSFHRCQTVQSSQAQKSVCGRQWGGLCM